MTPLLPGSQVGRVRPHLWWSDRIHPQGIPLPCSSITGLLNVYLYLSVPSLSAPKKILTEKQKQEIEQFWNFSTDATELTDLFNAEKQQPWDTGSGDGLVYWPSATTAYSQKEFLSSHCEAGALQTRTRSSRWSRWPGCYEDSSQGGSQHANVPR